MYRTIKVRYHSIATYTLRYDSLTSVEINSPVALLKGEGKSIEVERADS